MLTLAWVMYWIGSGGSYVADRFSDKIIQVSSHVCLASSGKAAGTNVDYPLHTINSIFDD